MDGCRAQACFGLKDSIVAGTFSKPLFFAEQHHISEAWVQFQPAACWPFVILPLQCIILVPAWGFVEQTAGSAASSLPFDSCSNSPCKSPHAVVQELLSGILEQHW